MRFVIKVERWDSVYRKLEVIADGAAWGPEAPKISLAAAGRLGVDEALLLAELLCFACRVASALQAAPWGRPFDDKVWRPADKASSPTAKLVRDKLVLDAEGWVAP